MLAIAHRAGNTVDEMSAAIDSGADLVEADVRYYRGALELRHKKAFGPWILRERTVYRSSGRCSRRASSLSCTATSTSLAWRVDTRAELDDARRLGVTGAIGKNVEVLRDLVVSP